MLCNCGRIMITTDVSEITYDNVIDVLKAAYAVHRTNVQDINYLFQYEKGEQPLQREKKFRPEIDIESCDNLAHYIVERHLAYDWGCPITVTQRGEKDSGQTDEAYAITLYNELCAIDGNETKIQKLARNVEICGLGYTYGGTVKVEDYEEGSSSYFTDSILHPTNTFMIYSSSYIDGRKMMGVTYRHDNETGNNYFTCFTKTRRFEIENLQKVVNGKVVKDEEIWRHSNKRSGEKNPLNRIPITEWIRSHDRTGVFEHQLSQLDHLNLLISDYANSVEENIQSIWHTNDIEFEKDEETGETKKPKAGGWVHTQTTRDGKTPIIESLTQNYDYSGQLENINATRARILEECNVPNRDTTSGGSTGVAADTITGYAAADEAANKKALIIKDCALEKVDIDLACIRNSNVIDPNNPLLKLRKIDCDISIKRDKNRELTTKINFLATAISHGINGLHAVTAADIWGDPNQVWEDSKPLIEAYQNSIFNKNNNAEGGEGEQKPNADRLEQDISDQIVNSPNLDGMTTGQAV